MDLLAGAAFTWCAVYVLLAGFFVVLAARREEGGAEYAVFAAACILVGAYALCNGAQYKIADAELSARWGFRAFLFVPLATAVILHVTTMYTELPKGRRLVIGTYAAAAVVLALAATRQMHDRSMIRSRHLSLGSLVAYTHHQWAPKPLQFLSHALFLFCIGTTLFLLVRAYVSGKREALLACIGGFVLLGSTVNDVLLLEGVHHSIYLSEHGFSAFAFGLSYTLLARHERVAGELTLKGAELRRRARQLRKAYEELRAAQEELVRKEQLALVGELAAVVSHEVRNPLAIISNAVAGLRRDLSTEDRETLLSILEEETDRLNRLVGDLLRYARPLVVERHRIEVDALVSRALELARAEPRVRLEVDIDLNEESPPVFGDPNLLRQVFDNLVQNACQAMPHGGTLSVKSSLTVEDGIDGVAIAFGDTGEGMDTQVRSRVGTPFFTTRPGGTGLGLAICDRIVTAHGGVLAIKSRSGEGTTVSVFLPTNRKSDPPALRSSAPPRAPTLPPTSSVVDRS